MRRRKGFTVIELVAVIVFVLIMGAILFPIFARVHDGYYPQSDCQLNLKHIGLAIRMYTNDNDHRLPQDPFRWNGRDIGWEEALLPYVKNDILYYCPVQLHDRRGQPLGKDRHSLPSGYGANRTYLCTRFPTPTVSLANVKDPGATIALAERDDLRRGIHAPIAGHGGTMAPRCNVGLRHHEGANFLFADGHVKWMKAGDVWSKDDTLWDLK
jgi:prepilin-type processing-associated H-X9-DG protein